MSSATFTPAAGRPSPARGATAATGTRHSHPLGNALRAAKVFASTTLNVTVLGEYGEETGVRRR
ncbi:hypothetical protein QIS99_18490 [Streptomyces sp. B-S-A8]|uniref:Uncharacterized protein n=1 Tax=Streptomyces solicavernae TaxID=3043614 RepID=A0ABT6RUQ8_9ACTN|nr:hypothetical protein [Streptomyces sp. B-S-A8]MDI3388176.1 hypothetical protein [Streptomyces sp. B-S-A8]